MLLLHRKGPLPSRLLVDCTEDFSGGRVNWMSFQIGVTVHVQRGVEFKKLKTASKMFTQAHICLWFMWEIRKSEKYILYLKVDVKIAHNLRNVQRECFDWHFYKLEISVWYFQVFYFWQYWWLYNWKILPL